MRDSSKRFFMQLSISMFAALATPALAAGLVAGTGQAVALANDDAVASDVSYSPQASAPAASQTIANYATHGPTRLSPLAGSDKAAWESAHAVHVQFKHAPVASKTVAIR